jgi:hypothetical protein
MTLFDRLFGRKTVVSRPVSHSAGTSNTPPGQVPPPISERPAKCRANPGKTVGGRITFTRGEQSWTETFNVVEIAAMVLRGRGHEVIQHEGWLELGANGFLLQPLMTEIQLLDNGVHTLTTVDVRHPRLVPDGLFEYQHSTGDDVVSSVRAGFESWESVDLAVLLDALRPRPEKCSMWEMKFPAKGGTPERTRCAVLGSVAWFAQQPAEPSSTSCTVDAKAEGEHALCTCCFLTRNFEAFRAQLEGDEYFGIRFYAARDQDGTPGADCRINGEDYEPGMVALRSYVSTWPGSGFEFRKQYVFVYTPDPNLPT